MIPVLDELLCLNPQEITSPEQELYRPQKVARGGSELPRQLQEGLGCVAW